MTDSVTIKEVAARDGLQAQSVEITLNQRRELIEALAKALRPRARDRFICITQSGPSDGRNRRAGEKSPQNRS
jgi:hypothetical protein